MPHVCWTTCLVSRSGHRPGHRPWGGQASQGRRPRPWAHLMAVLTSWCPHPSPGSLPVWDAGSSGCWWAPSPLAMPRWPRPLLAHVLGTAAPQNVSFDMGAMPGGHSRGPTFPQAAPRVSMANIATRSVTVTTRAAATASMEPASVTQGSTAAYATWVSPTARWLPRAKGPSTDTVPSGPLSSLG